MTKASLFLLLICGLAASVVSVKAEVSTTAPAKFTFKDANGKETSVAVVDTSHAKKIAPAALAKIDPKLDPKMTRAATFAQERSHAHSRSQCWHYVKDALVAAGLVILLTF